MLKLCRIFIRRKSVDGSTKDVMFPLCNGLYLRAAFLAEVLRQNVTLAQKMHDGSNKKAFALSLLKFAAEIRGSHYRLGAGSEGYFDIAALDKDVSDAVEMWQEGSSIYLGAQEFVLLKKQVVKAVSYESLAEKWLKCDVVHLPHSFLLEFVTPTAFRRGTFDYPLPSPDVLWLSLLRHWNEVADVLCPQVSVSLQEDVFMANWCGETKRYVAGKQSVTGFIGKFEYQVKKKEVMLRRTMAILSEFAEFAGAGRQTTAGMGRVTWQK